MKHGKLVSNCAIESKLCEVKTEGQLHLVNNQARFLKTPYVTTSGEYHGVCLF
jgi:hypothetical protein